MRRLKSILLASSWLLSSLGASALLGAAAHGEDELSAARARSACTQEVYTMGFEVETSGIKVQHNNEDEILVILESVDRKWQLTSDTKDTRIDSTNWVNLECRTVGGLTQGEVKTYIDITQILMRRIKKMCDSTANGQVIFDRGFFNESILFQSGIQWGSNDSTKRSLEQVTFATKRKISDRPVDKIKLMTACDECLEVFVFTTPEDTIGVEVKVTQGKHLDNASEKITQLTQKLIHEFTTMAKISGDKGWQLDNISIANLYGRTLKDDQFKPALPVSTTLTFSSDGMFSSLECPLRPQLTFSFPLRSMRPMFAMLNRHEASAPRLLRIQETLDKPLPRMGRREEIERRRRITEFQTLDIIKDILTSPNSDDIAGLRLLITSYIYELFVLNQRPAINPETGPKAFLKVVSRVPFSEIYELLTEPEQHAFIKFCNELPTELKDSKVKPYKKDAPGLTYETSHDQKGTYITDEERINLNQWLESIREPINRSPSPDEAVRRDLLSPPPYTAKDYSMGAVKISNINLGSALLEARGYAGMQIQSIHLEGKIDISLDNIENLINVEAEAFFNLAKGD